MPLKTTHPVPHVECQEIGHVVMVSDGEGPQFHGPTPFPEAKSLAESFAKASRGKQVVILRPVAVVEDQT